jgi:Sugar transport-related sRNA regulator N-term
MSMEMLAHVLRFANPQVSRAEHKLLMVLAYHTNHETGLAYPGRRLLAQELLITERHVKRLVYRLVKAGWLEVKPGQGRGHLSVYRIKIPPDEVIHRKGDLSRRRHSGKGDIFAQEKGTFRRALNNVVEPRERNLDALALERQATKPCARDGCPQPQCPHSQQCAYHACCETCAAGEG